MNIVRIWIVLFFVLFNGVTFGQSDPEYNIAFEIVRDGKTLDESNSSFDIFRLCDNIGHWYSCSDLNYLLVLLA